MNISTLDRDLVQVIAIAEDAGDILRDHFEGDFKVSTKSTPMDMVTEIDIQAEDLILERLNTEFPGMNIMTEESGELGDFKVSTKSTPMDMVTEIDIQAEDLILERLNTEFPGIFGVLALRLWIVLMWRQDVWMVTGKRPFRSGISRLGVFL